MNVVNLILGIPLLLWGRKLFWLFVATVGFVAGIQIAQVLIPGQYTWVYIATGTILGFAGIFLAVFVQRFAVTITGFFAGVYLTITLLSSLNINTEPITWYLYVAGGLVGSFLVMGIFDWALIFLSVLVGATLLTQTFFAFFPLDISQAIVFFLLMALGFGIQFGLKQRDLPAFD
jgi:hypothetical protein